ncbi:anti-sigma-F factor Fin family protein [Bacillus thermotolerans]|uniref:Fin protein n=1 Tax=Bacillus thermotolerans TaxID=1221996 RepID=A0A0F5HPV6_BACTR|nr:anti-sigma-F factor Fin family protein [Bacillus thermotolerans]KKB35288.1 Fin protein [Bacillus thermotolerans]KKB39404.1 Fin protein [Bacillus thermotolerans]KKB42801.1 Fin protein [Bacillus thermotolerans]
MSIKYICRHCKMRVGSVESPAVSAQQLGFHALTEDERAEMVQYDQEGNITIKTICEDCQESLQQNPDFHQYDYFIH